MRSITPRAPRADMAESIYVHAHVCSRTPSAHAQWTWWMASLGGARMFEDSWRVRAWTWWMASPGDARTAERSSGAHFTRYPFTHRFVREDGAGLDGLSKTCI